MDLEKQPQCLIRGLSSVHGRVEMTVERVFLPNQIAELSQGKISVNVQ